MGEWPNLHESYRRAWWSANSGPVEAAARVRVLPALCPHTGHLPNRHTGPARCRRRPGGLPFRRYANCARLPHRRAHPPGDGRTFRICRRSPRQDSLGIRREPGAVCSRRPAHRWKSSAGSGKRSTACARRTRRTSCGSLEPSPCCPLPTPCAIGWWRRRLLTRASSGKRGYRSTERPICRAPLDAATPAPSRHPWAAHGHGHSLLACPMASEADWRDFSRSSATSTIMSSCPPTILRRPSSSRMSTVLRS